MSIPGRLILIISAVLLLNTSAFAIGGSAKGGVKTVFKINQCGKEKINNVFDIRLLRNGSWSMETSGGDFFGTYKKKGKKLSLSLDDASSAVVFSFLGDAANLLCRQDVTIQSAKIASASATLDKKKLRLRITVKFRAAYGAVTEKGKYTVVATSSSFKKEKSPPITEIKPPRMLSAKKGTVFSKKLKGSDFYAAKFSGTIKVINRPKKMLGGVQVTPRDTNRAITRNKRASSRTTTYHDSDGNILQFKDRDTGVVCTAISPDRLPDKILVGDYGDLSMQTCDNNTERVFNWTLARVGTNDKLALLMIMTVVRDGAGKTLSYEKAFYTIDKKSRLRDIRYEGYITAENYLYSLDSKK